MYDKRIDCPHPCSVTCVPHPDPTGGNEAVGWEAGLEQAWALSPQPIAQCSLPHHLHSLGPGALAYNRGQGQIPQNRAPLTAVTRAGWEETKPATGWWRWPWEPVSSCSKAGEPQGGEGGILPQTVLTQAQLWSTGDNWEELLPPSEGEGIPHPPPPTHRALPSHPGAMGQECLWNWGASPVGKR